MIWVREPGAGLIALTFVAAFVLDSVVWPLWLERLSPDWLALVLIYWCMALPQRVGVGTGWLLGLLVDAAHGGLLGQHALAFAVVAFMTLKAHRQVRVLPLWQQAVSVFVFLLVGRLLVFWINGMIGHPPSDWWFLTPLAGGVIAWPFMYIILRDLRRRFGLA